MNVSYFLNKLSHYSTSKLEQDIETRPFINYAGRIAPQYKKDKIFLISLFLAYCARNDSFFIAISDKKIDDTQYRLIRENSNKDVPFFMYNNVDDLIASLESLKKSCKGGYIIPDDATAQTSTLDLYKNIVANTYLLKEEHRTAQKTTFSMSAA